MTYSTIITLTSSEEKREFQFETKKKMSNLIEALDKIEALQTELDIPTDSDELGNGNLLDNAVRPLRGKIAKLKQELEQFDYYYSPV